MDERVSESKSTNILKIYLHKTFFSIPNLYYKLEEDDLMPDYICAAPNTYGMHKCDDLPNYKMEGKVEYFIYTKNLYHLVEVESEGIYIYISFRN